MEIGAELPSGEQQDNIAARQNALQSEASGALSPRIKMAGSRAELLDTTHNDTVGTRIGDTDINAEMTATIMVKSKASDKMIDDTLAKIYAHEMKPLSAKEFNEQFGADPQAMERVQKFARDNGLTIVESELNSGRVELKGKVGDFNKAFQVKLGDYKTEDGEITQERLGAISLPKDISSDVDAVLGLDSRSNAEAHYVMADRNGISPRTPSPGFLPTQVAEAYDFPKDSMGAGQSVGIIELGGGIDLKDNAEYYKAHGLPLPEIQIVEIDGAHNDPHNPDPKKNADGEVALDSQIIGAVAPAAKQQLIFAPNGGEQGFIDAVTRATFARDGEVQNTAISISWGKRESAWDAQGIAEMDRAFKKAALQGISVFAAAGDHGAADASTSDGKFVADFPASDPWVTATGGTQLDIDPASGKPHEVVWNDGPDKNGVLWATGGGISQSFGKPDFQKGVELPVNPNPALPNGSLSGGRGVPDISGDASARSPYIIRVDGTDHHIGGTSAVAPLYAALIMRVNASLGKPVGFLNPFLYKHGNSGIFNDITSGDNAGFNGGPGWDVATGWGSIRGTAFLDQLRKDNSSTA